MFEARGPIAAAATPVEDAAGWRAHLALRFARGEDLSTRLVSRRHTGPLVVQRPFYPEGGAVPHVYVLHPPGGLVGGDRLRLEVAVDPHAHALMTTPAATKVYRSAGPLASQCVDLTVAEGGALEWLPQETILHDGTHAALTTEIHLAAGARFMGLETLCFGLPARGETFAAGRCRQRFELWRADRPLLIERGRFDAGTAVHTAAWGLDGARVHGLMVIAPGGGAGEGAAAVAEAAALAPTLSRLREIAAEVAVPARAGVTVLGGGAVWVCRYLGPGAEGARIFFQRAWAAARPAVLGRAPVAPRIWAT